MCLCFAMLSLSRCRSLLTLTMTFLILIEFYNFVHKATWTRDFDLSFLWRKSSWTKKTQFSPSSDKTIKRKNWLNFFYFSGNTQPTSEWEISTCHRYSGISSWNIFHLCTLFVLGPLQEKNNNNVFFIFKI